LGIEIRWLQLNPVENHEYFFSLKLAGVFSGDFWLRRVL